MEEKARRKSSLRSRWLISVVKVKDLPNRLTVGEKGEIKM
jgi:hypothetical protein